MKHLSTIFRRTLALVMLLVASQACSVYNFYKFNGASLDRLVQRLPNPCRAGVSAFAADL